MKCFPHWICAAVLIHAFGNHATATPARDAPADLGTQVRSVFAAKCAQCHSSRMARPKGKFGYILDIERVAANPKLVARFKPSNSKLWKQIADGDMPPDDAKGGPLAADQKQLIHLWIQNGAPAPLTRLASTELAQGEIEPPALPVRTRLLQLLGKLHVLIIHFPIALLMAAAIAESWWMWKGRWGMSPVVRYCVLLGAVAAVVAAALGWVHASFGGFGSGQTLWLHRWLGTAAGASAIAAALACELDVLRSRRTALFRGILFLSAALVGAAGHFGGMLVYGNDYFHF
jgi:uncharacterized membrane protein